MVLTESIVVEGNRIHQEGLDELDNVTDSLLKVLVQMTDREKADALQLQGRHAEATAPMTNSYANYELRDTSSGISQKKTASVGKLAVDATHKLEELEAALAALWKDFDQAQTDVERAYHVLIEPFSKASAQSDDANVLRTEVAKLVEAFETTSGQLIAGARNYESVGIAP
jgi:NADH dehydrogenase/NADH:ubiquinone oxidoreductase subunit G